MDDLSYVGFCLCLFVFVCDCLLPKLSNFSNLHLFRIKGCYVTAGSCTTGDVFVWKTADGSLETTLKGHDVGAVGVAWGRGGSNGQQVSSVDKNGVLILWA